jgi:hypothetical protein
VYQPQSFQGPRKEYMVCRLVKALCGLKQASKAWYNEIDKHLQDSRFRISFSDSNLSIKRENGDAVILVIYVEMISSQIVRSKQLPK